MHTIKYLFCKLRRRLPALLLLTLAHVGSAVFGVWFALGTRGVINSAVSGSGKDLAAACLTQTGIILGILVCLTISRILHDRLLSLLDQDWKQNLFRGLLHGDYADISRFHSGELINRLNNDVRTVNDGLLSSLPGLASMLTRIIAVLSVLIAMEPWFTLAIAAVGVVVALSTGIARKRLRGLHKEVSAAEGRVSGFLQECLEKLMLIQAMDVSDEVQRRADGLLAERYALQRKRRRVSLAANTCVSVLSYVSGFAALAWSAVGVFRGTMTFGDLTALTQLVGQLQGPFVNLSGFLPKYIAMASACDRLMELEQCCGREEPDAMEPWALYDAMTGLSAKDLTFSYGRDQVLERSSFWLPKGAFAVITGPSGIGKSTLLKLMLGVFRLDGGQISVETDAGPVPLSRATRNLFAYVPQGNLLFSGTLRENLILTKPDATEEEIRQAVYLSCMDQFLPQLPEGLETVLGENAHGLSEGQAQRLAIARAVLGGAPILLLDEVTSALDAETERLVLQRLRQMSDRTCIAVTHRPAALELADWQLQVDGGGIRAEPLQRR